MTDELTLPGFDAVDFAPVLQVLNSSKSSLKGLLEDGGMDPSSTLRFSDLRGWNFAGQDVRGVDFSFSDLRYTGIERSIFDETTSFFGALVDQNADSIVPNKMAINHPTIPGLDGIAYFLELPYGYAKSNGFSASEYAQLVLDANQHRIMSLLDLNFTKIWKIVAYQASDDPDHAMSTEAISQFLRPVAQIPKDVNFGRSWKSSYGIVGSAYAFNREIIVPGEELTSEVSLLLNLDSRYRAVACVPVSNASAGEKPWGVVCASVDAERYFSHEKKDTRIEMLRHIALSIEDYIRT